MAVQICKNDAALRKARVLKCRFDTPWSEGPSDHNISTEVCCKSGAAETSVFPCIVSTPSGETIQVFTT